MRTDREGRSIPSSNKKRLMLVVGLPTILVVFVAAAVVVRDLTIDARVDEPWVLGRTGEFDCRAGIAAILSEVPGEFQVGNAIAENSCHGSALRADDGNGTGEWTYRVAVERSDYDRGYADRHELDEGARECELLSPPLRATTKYSSEFGPYCVWRNPELSTDEERSFSEVGLVRSGDEIRVSIIVQSPSEGEEGWISPAVRLDMLEYLEERAASVYAEQLDPDHVVSDQLEAALGDPESEQRKQIDAADWCALADAVEAVFREREGDFLEETTITDYEAGAVWSDRFGADSDCYRAWKTKYTYGTSSTASLERFDVAISVHLEPWIWGESGLAAERSKVSEVFDTPIEEVPSSPQIYATELDGNSFELSYLVDNMHVVRIVCAGQTHFGSKFIAEDVGMQIWTEAGRLIEESNR